MRFIELIGLWIWASSLALNAPYTESRVSVNPYVGVLLKSQLPSASNPYGGCVSTTARNTGGNPVAREPQGVFQQFPRICS